jgi:hypothetical protein
MEHHKSACCAVDKGGDLIEGRSQPTSHLTVRIFPGEGMVSFSPFFAGGVPSVWDDELKPVGQ